MEFWWQDPHGCECQDIHWISKRLGNMKHTYTQFLWVQEVCNRKEMTLGKRSTHEMLANFLTKPSDENDILKCTKGLNLHYEAGTHKMSLKAAL